jgi:hypothetical protein
VEIERLFNLVFGLALIGWPIYIWWQTKRTAKWPTVRARVVPIETNRDSFFGAILANLNRSPSYSIEYEVNGKKYSKQADIENNVRVGGIKVWKSSAIKENFNIRHHPNNPHKYSVEHAIKPGTFAAVAGICFVAGLVFLYRGFTQYGT